MWVLVWLIPENCPPLLPPSSPPPLFVGGLDRRLLLLLLELLAVEVLFVEVELGLLVTLVVEFEEVLEVVVLLELVVVVLKVAAGLELDEDVVL